MSIRLHAIAAIALAGLAACGGSGAGSANPILGKWRAANGDCGGDDEMTFTPTTKVIHIMATQFSPASEQREEVVYSITPHQVITLPGAGGVGQAVIWKMPDDDTVLDQYECKYVREK